MTTPDECSSLPPIEAYGDEFTVRSQGRNNGAAVLAKPAVRIRNASEIARTLPSSAYVLRPTIEDDAVTIVFGDFGTFKSFLVLDWALRVALGLPALGFPWPAKQSDVVLISAEGRGLPQRLRAWCIHHFPGESYDAVLQRASLYCIEHPVNLENLKSAGELVAQVDGLGIVPKLIIIDTMSRNSSGTIEESTAKAGQYLSIIDQTLRARYRCAVVMTHHVGHQEKGRIRGPIVLSANTDALIMVERQDSAQLMATVTVTRTKDSEPRNRKAYARWSSILASPMPTASQSPHSLSTAGKSSPRQRARNRPGKHNGSCCQPYAPKAAPAFGP